jgi:hypothetical protein
MWSNQIDTLYTFNDTARSVNTYGAVETRWEQSELSLKYAFIVISPTSLGRGHAVAQLFEALRRLRVRIPIVSLQFFIDIILPAALWPWGQTSLKKKWLLRIIPGG